MKIILNKINQSKYIVSVIYSDLLSDNDLAPLRIVIYDYIHGENLTDFISKNNNRIDEVIDAFKICVTNLLNIGIYPYLKDTSDFIISENRNGNLMIQLVDLNTAIDISNSSRESRIGVLKILDAVIIKFVKTYSTPYRGIMQLLK